jgi:hypothetical protein
MVWEIMVQCFFIASSLTGKSHFISINNKKEIEGINQGTFSNIVWANQLQTITIV